VHLNGFRGLQRHWKSWKVFIRVLPGERGENGIPDLPHPNPESSNFNNTPHTLDPTVNTGGGGGFDDSGDVGPHVLRTTLLLIADVTV